MPKVRRLIAAIVLTGGLIISGTVAANAYTSDCSSGRICIYDNSNFGVQLGWRNAPFSLQNISSANNDKLSSWENHSAYTGAWFTDSNGGGTCLQMDRYTTDSYVGLLWNDQASSWQGDGGC